MSSFGLNVKLVDNPVSIGYLDEDFVNLEIDCKKLHDVTDRELNPLKLKAVSQYISSSQSAVELYRPVLQIHNTGEGLSITFIDGRHTFATLYTNMGVKRLEIMVPKSQANLFKQMVG